MNNEEMIYNEEATTEEVKTKKDYTTAVGVGAVATGAVLAYEFGRRFVVRPIKKGIVKLAGKIDKERAAESEDEPEEATE